DPPLDPGRGSGGRGLAGDAAELLSPRRPARDVYLPPKRTLPLQQHDLVPAQTRQPRRLEPCRPTADHHDEAPLFGIYERSELALPTALRRLAAAAVPSAEQSPEA